MDGISLDTALLFKYFRGLTTGEERKRVEDWMQISEENEKTVLQAARIFYISQTSERILSRNSIEAYKKVQKRIDKRKKKIRLYEISIVAACFVGLLVISTAISFLLRKSSVLAPQQITVCANGGVRTSLDLPDGSIAYLNSGSTLSYPSSYDAEERKVTLVGEAYFSVKHDPAHPFIVSVSHDRLRVKVLGTEFNVRAYSNLPSATTLVNGRVLIRDKGAKVVLKAGEQAVKGKNGEGMVVRAVDVAPYIAWKQGYFLFENERLEDILNELARWYNVNVFFENSSVREKRFSVDMPRHESFKEVLHLIEQTRSIRIEIEGNNVFVK